MSELVGSIVELNNVCALITDGTHYSPPTSAAGPFLYITSKNIREGGIDLSDVSYVDETTHSKIYSGCPVQNGDVLFVKDGVNTGTAALNTLTEPFSMLSSVALLRPQSDRLDPRYLVHWFNSPGGRHQMTRNMSGCAIRRLVLREIRRALIPVPPVSEQRRIAEILDRAEALRAKRRATLAQLDTLAQSIFLDLFGDPATNPLKFPRTTLGKIVEFVGGSQPPRDTFTYEESPETVRLVQIRDFKSNAFKTYIPRRLARRHFDEDDVMIGRYGPPVFQILRGLSGSYNVALIKAVPRNGVTKDFIFNLLQEKRLHSYVVGRSERTAGQTGVNLDLLENYPAYLPPISLQREFSNRAASANKLKAAQLVSLIELDAFFDALQHRAFRGEL